jgi:L-amino acid N-acyltransferase YncA
MSVPFMQASPAVMSPDNEPSLRLAQTFGFKQVGEQIDEIDGLELVFEKTWPPAAERAGPTEKRSRWNR